MRDVAQSDTSTPRSVRGLIWKDRCDDDAKVVAIEQETGVDSFTARLLAGRGVESPDVDAFLSPRLRGQLPDPSTLKDMDKATGLILDAIEAKKRIFVFADYDVDGGTSAAQLIRWGREMGSELGLYVPDRVEEGYGPSVEAFERLKAQGAELVITVDCGAAAETALHAAQAIDLPIVVIDHHLMQGDLPPAAAIINPNRPDDDSGLEHLAAAGVVFMTLVSLNRGAQLRGRESLPNLLNYIGFAALGTICDVVPLTGLNRALVAQGLKVLSQRKTPGIAALADVASAAGEFTTYHAGFVLGPRLNAGGRIGRSDMGAELLSTENAQLAYAHAAELDRVNAERKAMQDEILNGALTLAQKTPDTPLVMVAGENWHPGIIGIVAGRLKDRFDRPAIVMGIDADGVVKGSGRSIKGVNLGAAIADAKAEGLVDSGGGHAMAGGLTTTHERLEPLTTFLNARLADDIETARLDLGLKIDAWISPLAVSEVLVNKIDAIGPYGAGNPQPILAMADMRVAYAERLRGGHVRCAFEDGGGARINGICFRADESGLSDVLLAPDPPRVHIAGRIKKDSWKGRVKIDFQLSDLMITP